ncbi:glycosyltransferase family 4 protein [Halorubrum ezzemoulense]|uniref:glycosyltransferase family 4 protein n=1 Tax=Halorubrum ezzemoulense TaxID=337243 RepID=UPI00138AECD3|nr:glycosyltransferase family 4 protein [Halorubrum ezzemoulense]
MTLLGPEQTSDRIADAFSIKRGVKRGYQNKWLRRLLLVPLTFYLLYTHVRRERPGVVASFGNLPVNGLLCAIVSKLTSSISVVRVTSDFTNLWKHQTGTASTVVCFIKNNILGVLAIRLADNVIVLGPVMEEKLQTRGVDPSKLWAIPQPLHIEREDNRADESAMSNVVRTEFDIPDRDQLVLFVGYFKRSKGPKRLAQTLQYVMERSTNTHAVIVGNSGEYEEYVKQNLQRYDRIHFKGWVPHDRLSTYFQSADVLLHPSNSEGLPNVVLEALHYSVPVVATDSGGEVPVYVSNIGADYQELGEMLLNRCYHTDPCPETVRDPQNRRLYQDLFDSIGSKPE